MSKGIFAARAAVMVFLATIIGTTAAEAGGSGTSRTSGKCDASKVPSAPTGGHYDVTSLTRGKTDAADIGAAVRSLLDDPDTSKRDQSKQSLRLAAQWAAMTQNKGPLMLLDGNGCEWKVSTGKDLLALWSIAPRGFFLLERPAAKNGIAGDSHAATARPPTMRPIAAAASAPAIIRIADETPVNGATGATSGGQEPGTGGSKPSGNSFLKNVVSADAGEDLMLRQLGRLKDTIDGPSFSVGPPKSGSHASYDYEFKGAFGYMFSTDCNNVDRPNSCLLPGGSYFDSQKWMLVPFGSVWYGTEKNTTGSGSLQIDRFSAGTVLAVAFDVGAKYGDKNGAGATTRAAELDADRTSAGFVVQIIPQFITDHRFESKIAYVEGRTDISHLPDDPFWCFGDQFDGVNNGNVGGEGWGNVTCSAGVIMDYAHQFRSGITTGLTNSFSRLGFDVGASFKPVTDCDGSAFSYCDFAELVSFQVGYRNLWDYSGEGANVYRFTSSLKVTLPGIGGDDDSGDSGKGPSITISYTDGIEDITLAPIPTWKVSFSTGN